MRTYSEFYFGYKHKIHEFTNLQNLFLTTPRKLIPTKKVLSQHNTIGIRMKLRSDSVMPRGSEWMSQ